MAADVNLALPHCGTTRSAKQSERLLVATPVGQVALAICSVVDRNAILCPSICASLRSELDCQTQDCWRS